jgi:hypothetical protein
MLGAGAEKATLEEALADIDSDEIAECFYEALVTDALGLDVGKNRVIDSPLENQLV